MAAVSARPVDGAAVRDTGPAASEAPAAAVVDADPQAALEAALDRAALAAREAGIEPDDALGIWAESLRTASRLLVACVIRSEASMRAAVAQAADAAQEDRKRMNAATEHCRTATLKLEATFGTLQARADNLMTQAISSMADRVADKAGDHMVIVERSHNLRVLWRSSGLAALLLVAMAGVGWWLHGYSDRDADALLAACRTGAVQDRTSGEYYCPYGALPPP